MKRVIAILVALFYIVPTIGYSIDTHWCGSKIVSVSFSPFKPAKCTTCAVPKKCCKNTHTVVKLKDNQHGSTGVKVISGTSSINIASIFSALHTSPDVSRLNEFFRYHSPPPKDKQPGYLTNGVFRV